MVVVTGRSARCGSSMVCQTLNLLGMEMAADKFIPEHDEIRHFNENGFYEQNDNEGIKDDRFKGKCIKLWGYQLYNTDKRLISKLIFIERNLRDAKESYEKVRKHLPYIEPTTDEIFEANYFFVKHCIDENTLKLRLEEVVKRPKKFVEEIIKFVELNPNEEQVSAAINNIRPCQ